MQVNEGINLLFTDQKQAAGGCKSSNRRRNAGFPLRNQLNFNVDSLKTVRWKNNSLIYGISQTEILTPKREKAPGLQVKQWATVSAVFSPDFYTNLKMEPS